MQWLNTYDNVLRGYDFEYDGLNRLTASAYAEGTDMSQNKDRYSEYIPQYSPNGSIERLQRYGKKNNGAFGIIDDLTYQYRGNQIQSISDKAGSLLYDGSFDFKDGASESTEYFYNANGALTKDLNKGISKIEYDVLDNLSSITFNNGFKTKYVYDAGGSKLRTIHEALTTNTTDYIGDFIFEDGKLSKYQFEGGYCSFDSNLNPTYHYYEKDHLGSIRMVVNENGTIEQVNHYYPFGGVYGDLSYNSEQQRNKYIGKEFDHTSGLDWYDHGARMYDAAKGSWDRMDKLAEKYKATTPYAYSINNPSKFADIDGLDIVYMLQGGIEQKRIISKQNITYVQNLANQGKEWIKAEMPKILEGFSNAIYQKYDYLIAAETSYFNQNKNLGKTYRHTNGEFVNSVKNIPDLDPTLVKSIIMEETRMGTIAGHGLNDATKDIMQANVWYSKNSNDWNQSKEQFGLKMRQGATPYLSVHAGIGILYQKGLKSSVINNKKTTIFKGWRIAVKKYNGGGNRNYYKEVMNFYNNAK